MTREERLAFCKTCTNRKLDMEVGFICSLTGKMADFEKECPNYFEDEDIAKREIKKKDEKEIAEKGRKKTLMVIYLIIGLSLSVIILSHLTFKPLNAKEITKELIRLGIEIGLFYAIFIRKNWARIFMVVLFMLGLLGSIFSMIALLGKSPFAFISLILIFVYGYATYYFIADKDFNTFFEYQEKNE
jgi:hypothetical protein